jgi:hypothetical protein
VIVCVCVCVYEFHSILQNMYVCLVYMNIYCIIQYITLMQTVTKILRKAFSIMLAFAVCLQAYKRIESLLKQ